MRAQREGFTRVVFHQAALLVIGLHIWGATAVAGPEGATVVHGAATFQQSGNYTTIQASDRAVINYSSFDIARPETVQFIQPSVSASVLNRILSANPTMIDGTILANGRVFFVNPAGVVFGESAHVNVAQLVASALDISDTDFINGRHDFKGGEGSVINNGSISAERASLIGKQVANLGQINCPGGYVVMAAGDRVFLGEPGTNLLVEIDESGLSRPSEPLGGSAVLNEGTVEAAGGSIILAAAGDIYAQAISNVGRLSASASEGDAGTVKLSAPQGTVINTGSIEAVSESGKGGQVQVLGDRVGLFESSEIDVSGAAGGGTALVGGDYRGQGEIPTAARTSVGPDATIRADATEDGDGGEIVVWSDEMTKFYGYASATGAGSGDGGLIEVSGREDLSFAGAVALGAPEGLGGTLLLDPATITITNGGEDGSPQDDLGFGDAPSDATISELTLENTASGGNAEIVLEATNNIVMNDLSDNALTLSPGVSLVLRTRNNPAFQEPPTGGIATDTTDSIIASGGGNLTLQGGYDGTSFVADSAAHIHVGSLVTDGGSVTVQSTGEVSLEDITTVGADNTAGGNVLLQGGLMTASRYAGFNGTINTSGGPDTDGSGANPAGSVNISGGDVYLRGDIIATGGDDNGLDAQGGAGGSVIVGAPLYIFSQGDIRTSGGAGSTEGSGGDVTFNGATSLEGDTTVTVGNANVAFEGTVDGSSGALEVSSGGTVTLVGDVGGDVPLGSLALTGDAISVESVATEGIQTYTGSTTVSGDLEVQGTIYSPGIVFTGPVTLDGTGSQSLLAGQGSFSASGDLGKTTAGNLTLMAESGFNFDGSVTVANGSLELPHSQYGVDSVAGDLSAVGLTLYDPLILDGTGSQTLDAGTGIFAALDTLTKSVDGTDLTITGDGISLAGNVSGTGVLTFQPATATQAIYVGIDEGSFSLDGTELGYLQNGFEMINIGRGDGQHNLYVYETTFQDPVTFRSPAGGGIYVEGTVTGTDNASITLAGAGATTVLNAGIETPGQDITIDDSVVLGDNADITLSTGIGGGNISITGPINGTAGAEDMGDESLTLEAGTGDITVGGLFGASGAASTDGLTTITVASSDTATFGEIDITGALTQTAAATGATTFSDAVSVGSASLQGTTFEFDSTLTTAGDSDLTASGAVTFGGALTLGGELQIVAGEDVLFSGTIDDDDNADTSSNLAVNSGGTTRFNAVVGGTYPIDSITTDAAGTTRINANITTGPYPDAGPFTQTYNDPVVLTNNATLTDNGTSGIVLNSTLSTNGDGPWDLAVVTTDAAAEVQFNDAVTFDGALMVTTAGGDVTFQGTVDGEDEGTYFMLEVNSAGTTRFNAAVGGVEPLYHVFTDEGGTTEINADITTDGTQMVLTQIYGDPVVLTNSATLTDTGMNGIFFNGTVNGDGEGPWDLTVVTTDPAAEIQFNGTVDLDGGLSASAAGDIWANDLASATNNIELRSTGGDLLLQGDINADRDATGYGGGVSLIADAGQVGTYMGDDIVGDLNITITGYSDGTRGVDLPYGEGKAAIRIESAAPLNLGSSGALIANGNYGGNASFDNFSTWVDPRDEILYINYEGWARWLDSMGIVGYGSYVDDRGSVGFGTDYKSGGVPIDVAVYLKSTSEGTSINIDSPATVPDGATMVLDGADTIRWGETFTSNSDFAETSRLEIVSRITTDLTTEASRNRFPYDIGSWSSTDVVEDANPDWFDGYSCVLRGGSESAVFLATGEFWYWDYSYSYPEGVFNIFGTKYIDYDGDGMIEEGDTGVSGVTIFIDMDGSGTLTDGDVTTTTGEDGTWSFLELDYNYEGLGVYEVLPSGCVQTVGQVGYGIDGFHVTEVDGWHVYAEDQHNLDFANFELFDVSGTKFVDYDRDGVMDPGDTGLSGVTIFIDMDHSGAWTPGVDLPATTGEGGAWSFVDLDFTYDGMTIYEVLPSGYEQTLGIEGYTIVGTSGNDQTGLFFANYLLPSEEPPLPPPVPVVITPVVVPPIPTDNLEGPDWIRQAETIIGTIVPPHPECMDVKEEDIDILRKCQVACDLFSTDVSLDVVAEYLVTLNGQLKAQVQQVLSRLEMLADQWPSVSPDNVEAIEEALGRDIMLYRWVTEGTKFVRQEMKCGRSFPEAADLFLVRYLDLEGAAEHTQRFMLDYLRVKITEKPAETRPVARAG
ncbi:MAG: filamentous hemagglutinin N-terminal domain-containing protein [Phycisphaerales bacterium]